MAKLSNGQVFWWVVLSLGIVILVANAVLLLVGANPAGPVFSMIGMACLIVVCIASLRRIRKNLH